MYVGALVLYVFLARLPIRRLVGILRGCNAIRCLRVELAERVEWNTHCSLRVLGRYVS